MSAPQHMHTRKQMHTQMPRVAKVAPTKQQELLRLVSALSGACRADGNVLKDAQLVDLLESQAKAILQSRREKKQSFKQQQQWRTSANSTATATAAADAPTISPQRSKLIKKLADASDKSGGVSKRRKLSFETEPQQQQRAGSPRKAAMPPVRAFGKPAAAMDDGCGVNFVGDKDPAVAMDKLEAFTSAARSSSLSVFRAGVVDHMFQRSGGMSPQPFYKARAAFKSLDEASVSGSGSMSAVGGVDLSASMASTVASTSAGYYDDLYDDLSESRYRRGAHSPGVESRGRHTPLSELTQSVDSIDWSPSDDEDDELLAHATHRAVLSSASMSPALLGGGFDGREMVFSGDAETETEEVSCATASSTEAVMQVLYDILRQDAKYKWLVDSANQARVAKLVALHQREQQQGLDGNEDAKAVTQNQSLTQTQNQNQELRAQVEALVLENARLVEANELSACDIEAQQQRVHELLVKLQSATSAVAAAKAEVEAQTANATKTAAAVTAAPVLATAPRSDAETRLAATQQQLLAQESMRREAEAAFAAQLRAKSESVAALQQDVAAKDGEVARLMAQVAAISAAFVAKSQACSSADNDADGSSTTMTTSTTWSSGARRLSLSAQKTPLRGVDGVDGDVVESLASAAIHADASMILHLREVNVAREAEVQRLRSVLAAKDREICSLYMQLSTKKTVVDELAGRLAQTLQARGGDVALDVDLFLLESAVAKQQSVDELTAALGVMEREVETLEARVETLESENYRLTVTHEDAASTLESANAELLRVSAENELMESSLKEKQTRIRNLMLYLEEKEEQIMRLKDATEQQLGLAPLGAGTAYASFSDNARAY